MESLVIAAAVLFVGYLISLRLHPLRRCYTCRGTGRHWGRLYRRAHRMCRACGGSGRAPRVGARLFFGSGR